MREDIKKYCKTCNDCQINKPSRKKIRAPLKPIPVAEPFERVGVDCMGPMTLTENGNRFVVVFIDHFTKYVEAFATADITALTKARLFLQKFVCRHGAPLILQSDLGTDFMSQLMKEITTICSTHQMHTTAYHPMANGEVERSNQTLATRLRIYVNAYHTNWDMYLPFAVFATNIHVNESTGFSPFYLVYGRQPKLPIDAALNYAPPLHFMDVDSYAHEIKKFFTQAVTIANENVQLQ